MTPSPEHEQVADLLELLSDEGNFRIVERLLEGQATAGELVDKDVPGLNQSGVSRRIRELRLAGLAEGRGGRNAVHRLRNAPEIFALLRSALALAEAINEERQEMSDAKRRQLAAKELHREPDQKKADDTSA